MVTDKHEAKNLPPLADVPGIVKAVVTTTVRLQLEPAMTILRYSLPVLVCYIAAKIDKIGQRDLNHP